jgi:hypothetical protein
MGLTYVPHERIILKDHPEFDERWLQKQISAEPAILGLGEVVLIDRERSQGKAGRLDLLFSDPDQNRRYEVELMLGPTDPSHIVRTIEYWDIERRRYPVYEHVGVLVAEDITSRFLNVLALLSGSIPLMAIQLNALKVDDRIILDFVKVLDQTELRADDEEEGDRTPADRAYWSGRASQDVMQVVESVADSINEVTTQKQQLNYTRSFIGLTDGVRSRNFVVFHPRKRHLRFGVEVSQQDGWTERIEAAGLDFARKPKRLWMNVTPSEFRSNKDLIREVIHKAVQEYEA